MYSYHVSDDGRRSKRLTDSGKAMIDSRCLRTAFEVASYTTAPTWSIPPWDELLYENGRWRQLTDDELRLLKRMRRE